MTTRFTFKKDDTAGVIRETLALPNANANTNAATARLVVHNLDLGTNVERNVNVANNALGVLDVTYALTASDTNVAGNFIAEWQVTLHDGSVQTVPQDGYLRLTILPDLS